MIQLTKYWRIDNSGRDLILQQCKRIKVMEGGKPTGDYREDWIDIGYFNTLRGVFNDFFNRYSSQVDSLEEMALRIAEVRELIERTFSVTGLKLEKKKRVPKPEKQTKSVTTQPVKAVKEIPSPSIKEEEEVMEETEEDLTERSVINKLTSVTELMA